MESKVFVLKHFVAKLKILTWYFFLWRVFKAILDKQTSGTSRSAGIELYLWDAFSGYCIFGIPVACLFCSCLLFIFPVRANAVPWKSFVASTAATPHLSQTER